MTELKGIDFARIQELVLRTFQNPTADLVTSAFVLSAILVALLMLVLVFSLLLTPKRRKVVKVRRYRRVAVQATEAGTQELGEAPQESIESTTPAGEDSPVAVSETESSEVAERNADPEAHSQPDPRKAIAGLVSFLFSVPVLVALAVVGGYWVSGTDDFCARTCHAGVTEIHAARKLDHASCADCHEQPGITGVPANTYSRASMMVSQLQGDEPGGGVIVDSRACLRCHEQTVGQTVETARGIRISHKEIYAAGTTCVSCHPQTGHEARRDYSMSTCLPCHGGGSASTECSVCHTTDPYDARKRVGSSESTSTLGSGKLSYPVVRAANRDCGGCHNQERECDTCHGTRMPHDGKFRNGGHARSAGWEKKQMCYKCHEPTSCTSGCHIGPFPGHYAGFKEDHKKAPRDSTCSCHAQKWGRTTSMCLLCHDF